MARFVLRFTEKAEDAEPHVRALPRTQILDSSPRMFLVDGPEEEVRQLANARQWTLAEQTTTPIPKDPHRQLAPVGAGSLVTGQKRKK